MNPFSYPTLQLPSFQIQIKGKEGAYEVFDAVRKHYVCLTPEEWVRQHFVHFLIAEKGVPLTRIQNEQTISLYNTSKRCDTVVYAPHSIPLAIVEYKAPSVEITQKVFDQIGRYNLALQVKFLMVSNGIKHYVAYCDYGLGKISFLSSLPSYAEMLSFHWEIGEGK